jgi:N-acetylmuramoyl-L-alanine amidase
VHADAYASEDARGSSVWMLSSRGATSEAARWLADRENRADLVGGVSLENKDNTLAAVLLDLSQGATLEASGAVANQVLHSLAKLGPTHRGYVEKANFVVLRSPDVPSILVETAFITNPSEEKRLKSPEQREKLATAILDGIHNYFVAVPPPGTLFAANARHEKPGHVAARKPAAVAVIADDDPDREVLLRSPKS